MKKEWLSITGQKSTPLAERMAADYNQVKVYEPDNKEENDDEEE